MTTSQKTVLRAPLGILATATATHGTGRDDDIPLPRLPGFVESAFSPLAYEVSRQCLTERPGDCSRTAVALGSLLGDTTTADLASSRMVSGKVHNPLLFMQATPNSVLGHISREFQITGQMFSISSFDDPVTELLAMADLLLEDPELDRVLVLGVELGGSERLAAVHRELTADSDRPVPDLPASAGLAAAVLLGRAGAGAPMTVRSAEAPGPDAGAVDRPGGIQGLFDLVAAHRRLLRDGGNLLLPGPAAFVLTASDETETHAHQ
ncbi:hypothetical protein IM697_30770 [Streptomyces ferrugineus]|uniref:Beta-ketoacyl synthase N-terminal domain-containing protein n=1 Tax=Streptomyces ferrugineus TaxID=1413221 RepID=A0A7M2SZ19_9ACTN|nr:hypothetical protein [Streptomyces ferrugineus]QOV41384.1 hypothetical protein IM697_30770 [Streptomyces ferrugineus]